MRDLTMYAEIGDTVQFWPGGDRDQEPWAAIVTRRGNGTALTLNTVSPDLRNMEVSEGVRCLADKTVKAVEIREMGGWAPRPLDVQTRRMMLDAGVLVWNDEHKLVPAGEYIPKKVPDAKPAQKTTETKKAG